MFEISYFSPLLLLSLSMRVCFVFFRLLGNSDVSELSSESEPVHDLFRRHRLLHTDTPETQAFTTSTAHTVHHKTNRVQVHTTKQIHCTVDSNTRNKHRAKTHSRLASRAHGDVTRVTDALTFKLRFESVRRENK